MKENIEKQLSSIRYKQVFETGSEKQFIRAKDIQWLIETIEQQQKEIGRLNNRVEFCERMSKDAKTEIVHLQNELVKSGEEIERLRTVEMAYEALKKRCRHKSRSKEGKEMGLKQALFETINDVWCSQGGLDVNGEMDHVLTVVHVHESLAKAIENDGEEVPTTFDPNEFNQIEDGNYFEIGIVFEKQDALIYYEYD